MHRYRPTVFLTRFTLPDNAKSASGTFPPTSAQAPKRTARVWFDAATGLGKTLLKKLPDVVDTNPVKVVAAIVKVAIEAAEVSQNCYLVGVVLMRCRLWATTRIT